VAIITLTPQTMSRAGVTPTYTGSLSTANTYRVANNGRTLLHFKKTQATDCVVTIQTPRTVGGLAVAEHTVTVPASTGDKLIGALDPALFNVAGQNYLEFTLSNIDGLTVGVFEPGD